MNKEITIICREHDKCGSRVTATYIVKRNATAHDICFLSIRGRCNMELEYYATCFIGTDEEILLKAKEVRCREPLFVRI